MIYLLIPLLFDSARIHRCLKLKYLKTNQYIYTLNQHKADKLSALNFQSCRQLQWTQWTMFHVIKHKSDINQPYTTFRRCARASNMAWKLVILYNHFNLIKLLSVSPSVLQLTILQLWYKLCSHSRELWYIKSMNHWLICNCKS